MRRKQARVAQSRRRAAAGRPANRARVRVGALGWVVWATAPVRVEPNLQLVAAALRANLGRVTIPTVYATQGTSIWARATADNAGPAAARARAPATRAPAAGEHGLLGAPARIQPSARPGRWNLGWSTARAAARNVRREPAPQTRARSEPGLTLVAAAGVRLAVKLRFAIRRTTSCLIGAPGASLKMAATTIKPGGAAWKSSRRTAVPCTSRTTSARDSPYARTWDAPSARRSRGLRCGSGRGSVCALSCSHTMCACSVMRLSLKTWASARRCP